MPGVVDAADVVVVNDDVAADADDDVDVAGVVAAADAVAEMLKLVSHQFGDRAGQGEGAQRGKDNGDQQKCFHCLHCH